jgi:hypothetical protein
MSMAVTFLGLIQAGFQTLLMPKTGEGDYITAL